MTGSISLGDLNALPAEKFVERLGEVFEHSPWVAEAAEIARPFADVRALHDAMAEALHGAGRDRQTALVHAHPDLAGRLALAGELTQSSTTEQAAAGLDQCTPDELDRFRALNDAYKARFGFPFIMAVKGRTRADILAAFEHRLEHAEADEFATALDQIARIAWLRLQDLIAE